MARLFFIPQAVRIDTSGAPYAGAKANFYLAGTTTPTDTYTDSALATPHANPVVADAGGQFAPIYLDPAITYKVVITESDNTVIDTVDPVHVPLAAGDVVITDAAGYYTGTEVETALAEIGAGKLNKSGGTMTGNLSLSGADLAAADNEITRPVLTDYGITHNAITSTSNACTADLTTGNSFYHLLTENTTVTLSNPPASGTYGEANFVIQQDGAGGAYTFTFPAAVLWPGGTAPTITTSNDAIDVVSIFTIDGGTTWYGNFSQAYS